MIQVEAYSSDDQQVNRFTITLLKDNVKNKIVNGVIKIKEMLGRGIFD
jgi:hypothetical protein